LPAKPADQFVRFAAACCIQWRQSVISHPAINSAVLNGGERFLGTHDNPVRSDHGTRWFTSRLQTAIGMKIA